MTTKRHLTGTTALAGAVFLGLGLLAGGAADAGETVHDIVRAATDLPPPLAPRAPEHVRIDIESIELMGELADGTTFRYWTFDGQVPGPFIRVRVGDTVEVRFSNHEDSWFMHNIDLHAVTGPHGGGEATLVGPGEAAGFSFKALKPGLYVYHCATPMVAHHIANGMYGMILVEPEEGLPEVDREFYVMQGEIYTEERFGTPGEVMDSVDAILDERPEYFVFNGAVNGLSGDKAMRAQVGETIRIFFGVGGPNFTSSFHVIGEIFDNVWNLASLTSPPLTDVQTISVPPGGAAVVDLTLEVPGTYVLVDHALSRVERGLAAFLEVEGPANREIFNDRLDEGLASLR
jgi:nitrite reductase (NO-forming)